MSYIVPLSNKLKVKKIVQFVAEILVIFLVCSADIYVQTALKFSLLVSMFFHPNKLFFQTKKYMQLIYMDPLSNKLKVKKIVLFVAEILGILFVRSANIHVQTALKYFTFGFSRFSPQNIIFSNRKYTQKSYMVPLSDKLKVMKIVQFVAEILWCMWIWLINM